MGEALHRNGGLAGLAAQLVQVRQVLHRASKARTASLNRIATADSTITPANSCGIWKFSPQLEIRWPMPVREAYISAIITPVKLKIMEMRSVSSRIGSMLGTYTRHQVSVRVDTWERD